MNEILITLFSTFIMSFTILILEISLTRLFSVMFTHHYVFLIIIIVFSGLSVGGIIAHIIYSELSQKKLFSKLANIYLLFAILNLIFLFITTKLDLHNIIMTSSLLFISFIPGGIYVATIYKHFIQHNNKVYMVEIMGASFGALLATPLLNKFSPMAITFYISIMLLIVSILLISVSSRNKIISTMFIIFVIFLTIQFSSSFADNILIGENDNKEMSVILGRPDLNASVVDTRWSAFGRSDVVELGSSKYFKLIFIDGAAGSRMFQFNGNLSDPTNPIYALGITTANFPLSFVNRNKTLIIGSGGGYDVLNALIFDFNHIDAVEINPDAIAIVEDYSRYNGGIYTNFNNVHVYNDEGRSFMKRSATKYDVIMLNIPNSKTNQGTTGYSLAENYLFTADSFKDYLGHVTNEGYVVIVTHERFEIYKLISTIIKSLDVDGKTIEQIMSQMFIIENAGVPFYPTLILKKTPFSLEEVEQMSIFSYVYGVRRIFTPYSDPLSETGYDTMIVALERGNMIPAEFIDEGSYQFNVDIGPATDDKPFFFRFNKGLSNLLIPAFLSVSILATITMLKYFNINNRTKSPGNKKNIHIIYYFSSLGLGFMMIEIPLIQKFMLFLGVPTLAISTVLFSLLLSMGIGGFFSNIWKHPIELSKKSSVGIFVMVLLYAYTLPSILDIMFRYELIIRLIASFFLIFPIGILMGTLFPTGIRIMKQFSSTDDIAWMWGFNSIFSVIGSIAVVMINLSYGLNASLMLGGIIYLSIYFVTNRFFK